MAEKLVILRRGEKFGQWGPEGADSIGRRQVRAEMEFASDDMERIQVLRNMIPGAENHRVFNHSFAQLDAYDAKYGFKNVIAIYSAFVGSLPEMIESKVENVYGEKEILMFNIPKEAQDEAFIDTQQNMVELAAIPQVSHVFRVKGDGQARSRICGVYIKDINVGIFTDITHTVMDSYYEAINEVFTKIASMYKDFYINDGEEVLKKDKKKAIKKFPKVDLTWGLDPEFELLLDNRIVSAQNSIKRTRLAGVDGSGSQVEFRPDPAKNTTDLLVEFRKAMKEFVSNNATLARKNPILSAKGNTYPLGCHIHCSGAKAELLPILFDRFVALPVWNENGSARGHYKGVFEENSGSILRNGKAHGGWEYRSFPSSILFSPKIARIVFKVLRNLAKRYYEGWPFEIPEKGKKAEIPSFEQYKKYCGLSEKEYELWANFCKGAFRSEYGNVLANWKIPGFSTNIKMKYGIAIEYADDWAPSVRSYIDNEMRKFNNKFSEAIMLRLFGLKRDRGAVVSGFDMEGYENVPHDHTSRNTLGFPFETRVNGLHIKEFVERIETYIKENFANKMIKKEKK